MHHDTLITHLKHVPRLTLENPSHKGTGEPSDLGSFRGRPFADSSTSCCFANGTGRNWFGLDPGCLGDIPVLLVIMSSFCESDNLLWSFSPLPLRGGAVIFSDFSSVSEVSHLEAGRQALGRHSVLLMAKSIQ